MHEMQSILTTVCSICQSLCHPAHLGFTVQKWLNGSRCCLVEHSWGRWNIVLDVGPDSPQRGGGGPVLNFGTPLLSSERLKLEQWRSPQTLTTLLWKNEDLWSQVRLISVICVNYKSGPWRSGGSNCSICYILATPLLETCHFACI